ncbi:MAG: transporter [Candidatus Latescibacterota bacterium]|nr:MAG: transporter [Candidatus Latescibacterota bacterium]
MRRVALFLLLGAGVLSGISGSSFGQDTGSEELVTDRPDFTESGVVVPRGSVQFEGGLTWEGGEDDIWMASGPELLIRWGLTSRVELRIGLPDYAYLGNHESQSGFGDGSLGTKLKFGPVAGGWDIASIVSVSIPNKGAEFSSDDWDPELIVAVGRDLIADWSLGSQVSAVWTTSDGDREFVGGGTVVLGTSFGGRSVTGVFVEVAAVLPEEGTAPVFLHHGYTHLLAETLQLDLHGGFGLTGSAPDLFIGAGMSIRM